MLRLKSRVFAFSAYGLIWWFYLFRLFLLGRVEMVYLYVMIPTVWTGVEELLLALPLVAAFGCTVLPFVPFLRLIPHYRRFEGGFFSRVEEVEPLHVFGLLGATLFVVQVYLAPLYLHAHRLLNLLNPLVLYAWLCLLFVCVEPLLPRVEAVRKAIPHIAPEREIELGIRRETKAVDGMPHYRTERFKLPIERARRVLVVPSLDVVEGLGVLEALEAVREPVVVFTREPWRYKGYCYPPSVFPVDPYAVLGSEANSVIATILREKASKEKWMGLWDIASAIEASGARSVKELEEYAAESVGLHFPSRVEPECRRIASLIKASPCLRPGERKFSGKVVIDVSGLDDLVRMLYVTAFMLSERRNEDALFVLDKALSLGMLGYIWRMWGTVVLVLDEFDDQELRSKVSAFDLIFLRPSMAKALRFVEEVDRARHRCAVMVEGRWELI